MNKLENLGRTRFYCDRCGNEPCFYERNRKRYFGMVLWCWECVEKYLADYPWARDKFQSMGEKA